MPMLPKWWISCGMAVAALAFAGCGGGGGGSSPGGGGGGGSGPTMLRVFVTDAPFPFQFVESATVTINEVRVHQGGGAAWTPVFTGSNTIDLVPLTTGVAELLVEAEVPPGTYDMVRLLVDAGTVTLTDAAVVQGDSHTFTTENGGMKFPSGAQTGIKVNIENDIVVTTGLSSDLTLDFDLSKNFVFNGPVTHQPGVRRVIFTPHVKATNTSTMGSITLDVFSDAFTPLDTTDDTPIEGATVSAFTAGADMTTDAPVGTTFSAADGSATLHLVPGTYDLLVEAAGHTSQTILGVTVTLANLTDLGRITLAATGTITGTVMSDGGTPDPATTSDDFVIEGASVEVHHAGDAAVLTTVLTDASGNFQVSDLAPGNYDLVISADGFTTHTFTGVAATLLGSGDTYRLSPLTATVHGTLTDATATPVDGATVVATNVISGVVAGTTTTASGGTWTLTVPTGSYTFTFTKAADTKTLPLTVVGASPPSDILLNASF